MDLFLAACQGIGLALATGIVAGALSGGIESGGDGIGPLGSLLLTLAVGGAAVLCGASLEAEDHPAWPGWPLGALLAAGAFLTVRGVVADATTRGGSAALIALIAAAAGLTLAAVSLTPASPVALVVVGALAYLALARRRRAGEKHEGLRILR